MEAFCSDQKEKRKKQPELFFFPQTDLPAASPNRPEYESMFPSTKSAPPATSAAHVAIPSARLASGGEEEERGPPGGVKREPRGPRSGGRGVPF